MWRARMGRGDPFQDPLHAARVEAHMEEWVAAQVVKIDEKKWGSKVSQKLFVDREYVLKHIRNKHGHLLAAERDQVTRFPFIIGHRLSVGCYRCGYRRLYSQPDVNRPEPSAAVRELMKY